MELEYDKAPPRFGQKTLRIRVGGCPTPALGTYYLLLDYSRVNLHPCWGQKHLDLSEEECFSETEIKIEPEKTVVIVVACPLCAGNVWDWDRRRSWNWLLPGPLFQSRRLRRGLLGRRRIRRRLPWLLPSVMWGDCARRCPGRQED